MNGVSSTTSVSPTYGSMGVGSASTTPGGLMYSVSWTDSNGNLWFFGGYSATLGYNNDLWRFNTTTNQWIWVKGPGSAYQFGWYGTKGISSASNYPGARYLASGWADNAGNLWLYGGVGRGASTTGSLNDLWKYNTLTNQWTWMSGSSVANQAGNYGSLATPSSSNQPGGRYGHYTFPDNSGNLWMFGGYGYAAATNTVGHLDDMWRYNITSGIWTWMKGSDTLNQIGNYGTKGVATSSNTPGGRRYGANWKDNSGNLWMFGGYGYSSSALGLMNDLWKYDVNSGNWTWMSGGNTTAIFGWYGIMGVPASNNFPGSRYLCGQGITDLAGNLWLFGGYSLSSSSGGRLNDLWKYSITNDQWTWVRGSSSPNQPGVYGTQTVGSFTNTPGARYGQVTWRDNAGSMWVYGGLGYPSSAITTTVIGHLNDMWRFDICSFPSEPINNTLPANLTICSGNTTTLVASSSTNSVKWYASLSSTLALQTGSIFITPVLSAVGSASVYSYYAESESCAPSASRTAVNVTVNPTPTITVNSNSICAGGVFVMLPSGANTYTFSGGSQVVFPTSTTSYSVSGTSAQGCASATQAVATVTVYPSPVISVNSGSICAGNPFVMTPTGAATYSYSGGSATVAPNTTTFYVVTGTSSLGCVSQGPTVANILVTASPTLIVNSGTICEGESFTISPSGAASYSYSSGSTIVSPSVTSNYTVSGSNAAGCISSAVASVTVKSRPIVSANSGIICNGGSFTIQPSGAASYTFSGGSAVVSPTVTTFYTVVGSSTAGCVSSNTAVIGVMVNSPPILTVNSGSICEGATFTMTPSGASSYTFSNGSAQVSPTVSGTYSVTGTSSLGCVSLSPVIASVTVISGPVVSVNSGTICKGLSFTLSPAGATSYTISGGSAIVTPSATTTYSVFGSNALGCVATTPAIANVVVNTTLSISVNSGTICQGDNFVIIPSGAVTYTYSGGSSVVSPTTTTSYSVSGTASGGCVSSPAVSTVTVFSRPTISVNSGTICSGQSFTIIPTGAQTYTYSNGSPVVSPLSNSNYSVSGTSSAGCVSNAAAVSFITVNSLPVIAVNSGSVCANASFTMAPTGAASYTYSSGSSVVSPSVTSSYSVTGTSSLGCVSASAGISSVSVYNAPSVSVNSGSVCSGSTFTMIPSGAGSYTFSSGSSTVSPTLTSTYSVVGTGSNGCVSPPAISTVSVLNLPVITINSGSVCAGSSFTLTPGGALSYSYSGGQAIVTPTSTSSYSVTGIDAQGCVSAMPAISTVTVNSIPVISVGSGSVCSGSSFTLLPTGASSYTFSGGSAVVSPSLTSTYSVTGSTAGCKAAPVVATITVLSLPIVSINSGTLCSGNSFTLAPTGALSYTFSGGSAVVMPQSTSSYSVTGSDANGCISAPAISTLVVTSSPSISVNSGMICNGKSFTLSPSGASSFTYSGGSAVVSPTTNSTYTVIGSNAQACVSAPVISSVTVNALPLVTVNSGSICAGAVFTLNPSGASTYSYSGGSAFVSPLATSNYSVSGTSTLGCVSSVAAVATVVVHANPIITAMSGSICSGSNFTIQPFGALTYTYSSGSPIVSPATTSVYSISGTNSLGCIANAAASMTVNVFSRPVISVNSGSICSGGSFTLSPAGASSYTFSGGSSILSPTVTTSYSVLGTSSLGCISASPAIATLLVYSRPTVSVNSGSVCAGRVFTMTLTGASTYSFSNGSSTVSPLSNSNYSVTGTSSAGCASGNTAIATVTVHALPVVAVNSGTICAGNPFTLTPSGATTYTFLNGSATVQPLSTTVYSVTGTSLQGCLTASVALATVSVNSSPSITVNSGSICAGTLFTLAPAGALTYTYSGGSAIVGPTVTSSYSVTGTNANGCISTVPAVSSITVNSLPQISVNSGSICAGSAFVMFPSGAATYTFSSGSATVVPGSNTSYSVSGTNQAGCVSAAPAISMLTVVPLPSISVNSGTVCAGQAFVMTPVGAQSYTFSNGSATVIPQNSSSYTVTGTGSNGCLAGNYAVAQVQVIAGPVISVAAGSVCAGDSFTLSPSGAISYSYSGGSSVVCPVSTSNYTVSGTNLSGCSSDTIVTVTVYTGPTLSLSASSATICQGDTLVLSATGATGYVWNTGQLTSSISLSPLTSMVYTVTGQALNSCKSAASATIHVNACTTVSEIAPNFKSGKLYPNPTTGVFYVELFQEREILVINSIGQLVLKQQLGQGITKIELEQEARGIYFVYLKGKFDTEVFKLIKD